MYVHCTKSTHLYSKKVFFQFHRNNFVLFFSLLMQELDDIKDANGDTASQDPKETKGLSINSMLFLLLTIKCIVTFIYV